MDVLKKAVDHLLALAQANQAITLGLLLVFILLLILLRFIHSYRRLKKLKHEADKSWSNIQTLLTQRNNEVPKLLSVCRETFSKKDQLGMEEVVSARKHIGNATASGDIGKLSIAESMLRKELTKIFKKTKNYPDLLEAPKFKMIKARINGYNNALGDRMDLYNANAKEINRRLSHKTGNMAAGILGVVGREELKVQTEELGTNDLSTLFAS